MRSRAFTLLFSALIFLSAVSLAGAAGPYGPRPCIPDPPIPPESVGAISLPFDVPVWPTLLKTEFNIFPWVSLGRASICIPCSSRAIEFCAPTFSLKPIPIWIPWLRPLDMECYGSSGCPRR